VPRQSLLGHIQCSLCRACVAHPVQPVPSRPKRTEAVRCALWQWHLGTTPGFHPTYRGFDMYLGIPYSVDMGCSATGGQDKGSGRKCGNGNLKPTAHQWELALPLYHSETNCSGQSVGSCNGDIVEAPVNFTTLSDKYSAFASEFIGNSSHDPRSWFLYVPFSHIHTPQYVAPRNAGKSGKSGNAGHFYDTLLELDSTVGAIMAALAAQPAVDAQTLVFLSGDNGPWECKCDLSGTAGPFQGLWQRNEGGGGSASKTTLWEGGHREVGVARWTGKIKPRVSNATLSTLDFFPTFLSMAGIESPTDRAFDGIDMSAVLLDGSEQGHVTLFHPNVRAGHPPVICTLTLSLSLSLSVSLSCCAISARSSLTLNKLTACFLAMYLTRC
jgi:arylsulfatase A-like enzyme